MSSNPEEGLAPAAGSVEKDGAREVFPVQIWGKSDNLDLFDFRATPEFEEVVEEIVEEVDDPKDSSAAGSALAAIYETLKTPDIDSLRKQVVTASAEKEVIPTPESENGSATSSVNEEPKTGKTEQPVPK